MADENKDAAPSLGSVFDGGDSSSSPAASTSTTEPQPSSTDSKDDKSSPSSDSEKTLAAKDDKSPEKSDPPSEPKDKQGEAPAKDKPEADKKEDKPKVDPDKEAADEEAAVSKEEATFKQRFEDTQKWGHQLKQQNDQLREIAEKQQQQLQILQKKVDGTWTDDDEATLHKGESTEDVASRAVAVGKAVASKAAAIREFGQEKVNEMLTEFREKFGANDMLKQVITNAESPVHEVRNILGRANFEQKFGNDPHKWQENVEKSIRASIEKEVRKQVLEEIRAGKSKRQETPEQLNATPGAGDGDNKTLKEGSPNSLQSIFG